ncbi:cell wall-active antibiotics response protein LiaF [Virgibacillus senegalensis]|uniref:cell wall-active antibiotics response protein LiaF n=1 Tax=Virgibacillus senegalensis TaxID=1499679 RepID=UPI00069CCC2D|nr:cell wall-active antibiotics response protein LiaF [Virgibacillus senegalensis]
MFNRKNTDLIVMILLITVVIFVFELLFDGPWLLFCIIMYIAAIYYGRLHIDKSWGRLVFWAGLVGLIITILNTTAFRFLLLTSLAYLMYRWYHSKKQPVYHKPQFEKDGSGEGAIQRPTIFTNKWFGRQKTSTKPYEWQDINIQTGIGDAVIDMNNTVLPKGEAVIFIRNLFGNMEILVPYEVEVSISHSTLFGSAEILDYAEDHMWNKVIHIESENYQHAKQKVKIVTSTLAGKIEVKRV